jgi:2-haloacid dehalogenase
VTDDARATVRALTFDVFGTVVDWRGSIIREGERLNRAKGLDVDWARFADAWRGEYGPSMNRVRRGELPWTSLDALHRMALDMLLDRFRITALTEAEKEGLNRVWHRLQPWSDSAAGLAQLQEPFVVATLSNGHVALLVDLAKAGGLTWDCILSAELARAYKPDPIVYQTACALLDCAPAQVMMVACHPPDLRAAQAVGMRAAYVARPLEWGPNRPPEPVTDGEFDIVATDFLDLARQLNSMPNAAGGRDEKTMAP